MTITIERVANPGRQPYPKNGNFGQQKMTYDWRVCCDGRPVGSYETLKAAKELAGDFGNDVKIIR
jgi:electron transfer flavoprotein alpha subunit